MGMSPSSWLFWEMVRVAVLGHVGSGTSEDLFWKKKKAPNIIITTAMITF